MLSAYFPMIMTRGNISHSTSRLYCLCDTRTTRWIRQYNFLLSKMLSDSQPKVVWLLGSREVKEGAVFLILSSPHYTTSFWLTVELCLRAKANRLLGKLTWEKRYKNVISYYNIISYCTVISVTVLKYSWNTIVDKNWGELDWVMFEGVLEEFQHYQNKSLLSAHPVNHKSHCMCSPDLRGIWALLITTSDPLLLSTPL